MTTTTQVKSSAEAFRVAAKKRMIEMSLSIAALAKEFDVHRNSISLAIRHPQVLPDLHKRVAQRLSLSPE